MPNRRGQNEWQPLGGKSRNFRNVKTGEVISRRQYDKRFGTLAKQGFKSYEQKAKSFNPEVKELRPARGRKSRVSAYGKMNDINFASFRQLQNGRRYREFEVPIPPEPGTLIFLLRKIVNELKRNPIIGTVAIGLVGYDTRDKSRALTPYLGGLRFVEDLGANELAADIADKTEADDSYAYYYAIKIHARYKDEIKPRLSPQRSKRAKERGAAKRKINRRKNPSAKRSK